MLEGLEGPPPYDIILQQSHPWWKCKWYVSASDRRGLGTQSQDRGALVTPGTPGGGGDALVIIIIIVFSIPQQDIGPNGKGPETAAQRPVWWHGQGNPVGNERGWDIVAQDRNWKGRKASAGSGSGSRKKLLKSEMESGTSKKSHQPDQIKVLLRWRPPLPYPHPWLPPHPRPLLTVLLYPSWYYYAPTWINRNWSPHYVGHITGVSARQNFYPTVGERVVEGWGLE